MAEMQIPWERPERINTVTESIAPWVQMRSMQQQQKLGEMKMQQAEQEQARAEQLRGLYANGQRPTADQMYSIDPEMGMQYEHQQAQNELAQANAQKQKMAVAQDIATGIKTKMEQSGLQPGSPEFQQQLDAVTAPYKPVLSSIFGKTSEGPTDWNALTSIAGMGGAGVGYHPPVNSNHGVLQYGPNGWQPIKIGDQVAMPVPADVDLARRITAAKEGEKGVEVTSPTGQTYRDTQRNASGGRVGGYSQTNGTPNPAQQPYIDISPDATPEERAMLEGIARQTGGKLTNQGPVMGPTLGEVVTDKETAKNDAELIQAKQKRLQSVGNMLAMLQKPIQGQDIESLIKNSTGSGLGSMVDSAAQFIGKTTKGAEAISKLQPIAEWLVSMAPRMEGPQSNFDVERYKAMAGNIGDPTKTPEQRIAAYRSLKGMLEDYLKSDGAGDQKQTGKVKFLGFE